MQNILQIAAIIAPVIAGILAIIQYFSSRNTIPRLKLNHFKSPYFEYHWSNPSGIDGEWIKSKLKIKYVLLPFFNSCRVEYSMPMDNYKGRMYLVDKKRAIAADGDIFIKLSAIDRKYPETFCFRYHIPVHTFATKEFRTGIWMSYNFNHMITCGVSVLSTREFTDFELGKILEDYFEITGGASIIVRRDEK